MPADIQSYDVLSFAKTHNISRSTVYAEIAAGRLRTFKVGRRTLISREAAEAWRRALEQDTQCKRANDTAAS